MVVARWNLAVYGCGQRDEKLPTPALEPRQHFFFEVYVESNKTLPVLYTALLYTAVFTKHADRNFVFVVTAFWAFNCSANHQQSFRN